MNFRWGYFLKIIPMKTVNKTIALVAIASVFLATCKKEEPEAPTNPANPTGGGNPTTYSSLTDFFNHNGAQSQFFTLDASAGGTFTGAKGTLFTFQSNSFATQSGNPVSGTVNVELKEMLSKKDMLLSNRTTTSYSYPLISGGEYYLNVTQNNQQLKLASGVSYTAQLPSTTVPLNGMQVFNGQLGSADNITWNVADSIGNWIAQQTSPYSYVLTTDSMHWVNCDQFGNSSATWTDISVSITNIASMKNAKVYIYYDGMNSIFGFWTSSNPFSTNECWLGQNVHIVAIGVDNSGNLYSSFTPLNVTANMNLNITLSQTTDVSLKSAINALP
jgi:hypothetical protein